MLYFAQEVHMSKVAKVAQVLKSQMDEHAELVEEGAIPEKTVIYCCKLDVVDVEILQKMASATGTTKSNVGGKLLHAAIADALETVSVKIDWDAVEDLGEQVGFEECF